MSKVIIIVDKFSDSVEEEVEEYNKNLLGYKR